MRSAPETAVELARRTREAIGPRRMLAVDVGYLWDDVGLALRVAEGLLAADVFFLETPFPVDSLAAYAELAAKTRLRIAAGGHSVTRWEFLARLAPRITSRPRPPPPSPPRRRAGRSAPP
jgi:L-alanine-DL-glutamate epimerase-like enolase superfamily enzyme